MWRFLRSELFLAATLALLCGVAGFVLGRAPARARNLQNELARLQLELDRIRESQAGHLAMKPQAPRVLPTNVTTVISRPSTESQSWKEWAASRERQLNDSWVTKVAADRDKWYTSLMSNLGMDPQTVDRFTAEVKELHQKAIVAGEPLFELAAARNAYDEKMRSALGDKNYELYRSYESRIPAMREYELLQKYALEQHLLNLDPADASQIVDLMYAAGATTTETWDGPYDPLPRPAAGKSQVLERRTADYNALVNSSAALMNVAAEAQIPEDYRNLLQDYYRMKIEEVSRSLANLHKPLQQIYEEHSAANKQLIEEMKARGEIEWKDGSRH